MNTQRIPSRAIRKGILVLFIVLLAFQSFGIVGYAAPVVPAFNFQDGGTPETLICSSNPTETGSAEFCNVQIVLLIDDSGSMKQNDPQNGSEGGLRNQGARHLVDVLATQYYLPIVRLKEANPDRDIELPVVQVAVVHFTEKLLNVDEIRWVTIDPSNLDEWNQQKDQQGGINDLINLNYGPRENTSFKEPFEKARELFGDSLLDDGCGLRSIMLFTDGAPYDPAGLMRGPKLNNHMSAVKGSVDAINATLPNDEKVQVYITGFNRTATYLKYWDEVAQPAWWNSVTDIKLQELGSNMTAGEKARIIEENDRIIQEQVSDPKNVQLLKVQSLVGEDYLTQLLKQLPTRMEAITAKLIGVQREEITTESLSIPKHVQAIRLTLFNLDSEATLAITDPDGNALVADGTNVIVSGEDSAIETWDLNLPAAGDYQVQASKSGGTITKLITYQNLSVEFVGLPDEFVVSETADIRFKLFDSSGDLLLAGDPPAYTLEVGLSVTLGDGEPAVFDLNQAGDEYQTSWTPPAVGDSLFTVEARFIGGDGGENLLLTCKGEAERPVADGPDVPPTPPTLDVDPPNACLPVGEPIEVPIKVDYEGVDRSSVDSLDLKAEAASLSDPDQSVNASIITVDANSGDYLVTIDPGDAKEILLVVSAEAVIDGETFVITEGIETTYTICETPPPCDCTEGFPIWLIFIFLMMWVIVFLMGWVILRDMEININFWILIFLEIVLAVVWFILFINYRMHLLWMLILLAVLVIFLLVVYRRKISNMMTWWLIILLTLFVSIWFVLFAGFPFWLFVLLLLVWLGIMVLVWIYSEDRDSEVPSWILWLVRLLLLVAIIVIFMYFSSFWIFLLVWLLAMLVAVFIFRVIGPICPPLLVVVPPDDLTVIEGIGPDVEQLLNEYGVYTFKELMKTKVKDLNNWLNANDWDYMDPKTWPYQAELAEKAKVSGKKEDQDKFDEYKAWVKDGIAPDEYNKPEDERSDEVKKPPEEDE